MSLEESVKKWIYLDNEIRLLTEKINEFKNKKNGCSQDILVWLSNKNLKNPLIKINDGRLKIVDSQHFQPLSYKFLFDCFLEFFDGDQNETIEFINFIKSKRSSKMTKEIKRFMNRENLSELRV